MDLYDLNTFKIKNEITLACARHHLSKYDAKRIIAVSMMVASIIRHTALADGILPDEMDDLFDLALNEAENVEVLYPDDITR